MLKYIELKSDHHDDGPAWVARVKMSQSGRTVYFDGKALKRTTAGISGNHYDLESGKEYWVSGVKRDGRDRHWAGSGKVLIEASAVQEYLELVGKSALDQSRFVVISDLPEPDPRTFHELENEQLTP